MEEKLKKQIEEFETWLIENLTDNLMACNQTFEKNKAYHCAQYEESRFILEKFKDIFNNK